MRRALCLTVLLAAACSDGGRSNGTPNNFLLVTFDTTRSDHIGAYGYSKAITPTLDNLASTGVRFTNCISPTPITLPSHASILTGMRPIRHGARNNATHPLPVDVATLAERLADEGFSTGAVVSALVLDSRYGLARGFEHYDDDLRSASASSDFMIKETAADNTVDRAIAWLEQKNTSDSWFLWVHFFDPHASYEAPAVFADNHPGSAYDAEITFADAQLGRLLAELEKMGQRDETLIAVTADHGESLGEHGERTHGLFIYDATTHVPLIINHKSLKIEVREQLCGSVDIAPTVCKLLNVEFDENEFDGSDLFNLDGKREPVYQESMVPFFNHGWSDLRGMRGSGARFIKAPRDEYQRFSKVAKTKEQLKDELTVLLANEDRGVENGSLETMSSAERQAMADLGYIWDSGADHNVELADPKDKVNEWEANQEIYELVRFEKWDKAEKLLRSMIAGSPLALDPHKILARVLQATNRKEDAHAELLVASKLPAADSELFVKLAESAFSLHKDWKPFLVESRRRNPEDPTAWIMEGDWSLKLGDGLSAENAYQRALSIDGSSAQAWSGLGRIFMMKKQTEEAASALDRALKYDPSLATAWFGRGVVAMNSRDFSKAEECFREAIHLKPDYANAYANLGSIYFKQEDFQGAREAWETALRINPKHQQAKKNLELLQ